MMPTFFKVFFDALSTNYTFIFLLNTTIIQNEKNNFSYFISYTFPKYRLRTARLLYE